MGLRKILHFARVSHQRPLPTPAVHLLNWEATANATDQETVLLALTQVLMRVSVSLEFSASGLWRFARDEYGCGKPPKRSQEINVDTSGCVQVVSR